MMNAEIDGPKDAGRELAICAKCRHQGWGKGVLPPRIAYWAALLGASLLVTVASASGRGSDMLSISVEVSRAPDIDDPAWPWHAAERSLKSAPPKPTSPSEPR